MSPIGRTFIVINLILAGAFTYFAGALLQNQNDYKKQLQAEKSARADDVQRLETQISAIETERNNYNNAKTVIEQQLGAANNTIAALQDDKKRLTELTQTQRTALLGLETAQSSLNTDIRAASAQAKEAYAASIAAGKARDEAIREKDSAVAENRQLKNDIVGLNSTIQAREASIATLTNDNSQKDLLLAAARTNGFLDAMAAPTLAGTVTNAAGSLLTVSVADNPGNVDIQDVINKLPFRFAIYGDDGYKGDAVAQKYEASANAVLCKIVIKKENATIRTGDRATTNP